MSSRFTLTPDLSLSPELAKAAGHPERMTAAQMNEADAQIAVIMAKLRAMKDAAPRYEFKQAALGVREPRHFLRREARRRGDFVIE
jgi:hypothetical protein